MSIRNVWLTCSSFFILHVPQKHIITEKLLPQEFYPFFLCLLVLSCCGVMMMREVLRQKEKSLQLGTHKEEITSDDSCVRLLHSLLVVAYEKPIIKKKLIVLSMVGFICMIHIIRLANRKARFINSCYRKKVLLSSKC